MVIDAGKVGIGTLDPQERLEITDGNILIGGQYKNFVFHTKYWDSNSNSLIIAPENNGTYDWDNAMVLYDYGRLDVRGKIYAEEIEESSDNQLIIKCDREGRSPQIVAGLEYVC